MVLSVVLAVEHIDPAKVELAHQLAERYPVDMNAPGGVPNVLRTKQPELTPEITEEMLRCLNQRPRIVGHCTQPGYQFRDDNFRLLPVTVRWEQFHSSQQNPEGISAM